MQIAMITKSSEGESMEKTRLSDRKSGPKKNYVPIRERWGTYNTGTRETVINNPVGKKERGRCNGQPSRFKARGGDDKEEMGQ